MDMSERLSLLFAQDMSLLQRDTGLRVSNAPSAPAAEQQVAAVTPPQDHCIDEKPLDMMAFGSRNGIRPGTDRKRLDNKKEDLSGTSTPKQHSVLDTGVEPPPALLARAFCPALAISKLPYKYMRGEVAQAIGRHAFDQGRFWQRKWDLYYVFLPPDVSSRAILLVPAEQVQQLLNELNQSFQTKLSLPTDPDVGLLLPFEDDGTPQPQYLGQSYSREIKDELVAKIPESFNELTNPVEITAYKNLHSQSDSAMAFRSKLEAGLDATRNRCKAVKERKRVEKVERQREWTQSLKRAQCYMGLHPHRVSSVSNTTGFGASDQREAPTNLSTPHLEQPAPFPFAYEPIFVCIDVESNERRHREITEIGVSTLDTLDLVNVAPGNGGENWIRWIRSRHIRIKESAHIVNHTFVSGCPNRFDFGESEFVSLRDASRVVEGCFTTPYSAQVPVKFVEHGPNGEKARVTIETAIKEHKLRPRNVVLVGHGVQGDIDYLRLLGCNIFSSDRDGSSSKAQQQFAKGSFQKYPSSPRLIDCLDTASMFQVLKRDTHHRALDTILNSLGIIGWNLHNAGNDARYTLEAMVRIILNSRLALGDTPRNPEGQFMDWGMAIALPVERQQPADSNNATQTSHKAVWEAEVERRVAETVADSEMRVRDECKIWEIVTGWDSEHPPTADDFDGGEPKGVFLQRQKQKSYK